LNSSIAEGDVSEDSSAEVAKNWMAIADTDGSGTIDIEEFKEFIVKLDSSIEEDKIKSCFDGQDEASNGELSVDSFGKALFDIIKGMKEDN